MRRSQSLGVDTRVAELLSAIAEEPHSCGSASCGKHTRHSVSAASPTRAEETTDKCEQHCMTTKPTWRLGSDRGTECTPSPGATACGAASVGCSLTRRPLAPEDPSQLSAPGQGSRGEPSARNLHRVHVSEVSRKGANRRTENTSVSARRADRGQSVSVWSVAGLASVGHQAALSKDFLDSH